MMLEKKGLKENNSLNHGLDLEKVINHGYTEHKKKEIIDNNNITKSTN